MTPRRRSGVALLAAGSMCLLGSVLPAFAADEPGSQLGSWGLSASAPGVQLRYGDPTYCFTTPASTNGCEGVVPEATSSLQNGPIGSAIASIVWPGSLAANLGSLIITAGGSDVPDSARTLNYPVRAEARTGASPETVTNDQVQGTSMKATAKDTSTSAAATVDDMSAEAAGTFGSIKGTTDTSLTGPRAAVSKAFSSVSDISFAAGVVRIGSVTSTAEATTDGTKATVKGSTTVSGATIGGVPVTIDERGVTVQEANNPLATSAVNAALQQAGMTLLVSEPQGKPEGADVVYTTGSLVAVFTSPNGYSVSVVMGGANVAATAAPGYDGTLPPDAPIDTGVTPPVGSGGAPGIVGDPGTSPGSVTSPTVGEAPPTSTEPPGPVLASGRAELPGGLSPWLVATGLLGSGLMMAGMRRLPDRVLETLPPTCLFEETA